MMMQICWHPSIGFLLAITVAVIELYALRAQFQWQDEYDSLLAQVEDMTRDEVVASLKRQSTGFSRWEHASE